MTKKRALSYIRMSTEEQLKGHSLQRQLEMARAYAKEKDFELIEDLRELGLPEFQSNFQDIGLSAFSGANTKKGKLGVFLKALEEGKISKDYVLLVESFDRLSRQTPMEAFSQFSEIIRHGIEIHTISESDRQIYNSETLDQNYGLLFSSIGQMLRANSESKIKSKRLKSAWKSKRDKLDKRIYTSRCPAWLSPNKEKTSFNEIPDAVKVIRKIFDLCISANTKTPVTAH